MPPPAPRLGTVLTAADKAKRDALSNLVDSYVEPYLARNATCADAVNKLFPGTFDLGDRGWVQHSDENPPNFRNFRKRGQTKIKWDHLAFRSFDCVDGGLTAVAGVFERFGYTEQGELRFAEKKVVARWFAPPDEVWAKDARGEPLFPRYAFFGLAKSKAHCFISNAPVTVCPYIAQHGTDTFLFQSGSSFRTCLFHSFQVKRKP